MFEYHYVPDCSPNRRRLTMTHTGDSTKGAIITRTAAINVNMLLNTNVFFRPNISSAYLQPKPPRICPNTNTQLINVHTRLIVATMCFSCASRIADDDARFVRLLSSSLDVESFRSSSFSCRSRDVELVGEIAPPCWDGCSNKNKLCRMNDWRGLNTISIF